MKNFLMPFLTPLSIAAVLLSFGCSPKEEATPIVPAQSSPTDQKLIEAGVSGTTPSPSPSPTPTEEPKIASINGDYDMDVLCDTNDDLRIKKISITDKNMMIQMIHTNKAGRVELAEPGSGIATAAPGELAAFYIKDPASGTEYKLLNVEGLAISPKRMPVKKGDSVNFTLTFERIPDTVTKFHVIEGKQETLSEDGRPMLHWKFMNVKLPL